MQRKYVYLGRIKNFTHIITYINIKNGLILINNIIIIMKVDNKLCISNNHGFVA
jgi:hypothetical protein